MIVMNDSDKQDKLNRNMQELMKSPFDVEKLLAIVLFLVVGGGIIYKCLI